MHRKLWFLKYKSYHLPEVRRAQLYPWNDIILLIWDKRHHICSTIQQKPMSPSWRPVVMIMLNQKPRCHARHFHAQGKFQGYRNYHPFACFFKVVMVSGMGRQRNGLAEEWTSSGLLFMGVQVHVGISKTKGNFIYNGQGPGQEAQAPAAGGAACRQEGQGCWQTRQEAAAPPPSRPVRSR
eukprot:1161798-Pelagomonas_calceolata.AAC.3